MKAKTRSLLAVLLALIMTVSLVTAFAEGDSDVITYADAVAWDGCYDVVVVGFGAAGAVSARAAAEEGATVLVLEKAPEGNEGGNSRYCAQMFVYGNDNEEATYEYFRALAGDHTVNEAMLRVYTNGIAHLEDTVSALFDIPKEDFVDMICNPITAAQSPEYPELPGSDFIAPISSNKGAISDSFLYFKMKDAAVGNENVDVWYESPAIHLIQDPSSKTIIGVQAERDGELVNIRALNGVVLACGGFENNREMTETFLGITEHGVLGTLYNTGDGIRMAQEVGAKLWHMNVYEALSNVGGSSYIVPEGERGKMVSNSALLSGSSMVISGGGTRFINETIAPRHGHVLNGDVYENPQFPQRYFVLVDDAQFQKAMAVEANLGAYAYLDGYEYITTADNLTALAEALDIPADKLAATVSIFNDSVESGVDPVCGRDTATMAHFDGDGTVHAVQIIPNILNTQGGPMRNENSEIVGLNDKPIPHLYSAGELGGITTLQYQGGGNMAECLIFGQLAGKNAAAPKDPLPEYKIEKVESDYKYLPGVVNDAVKEAADVELAEKQYYGEGQGIGGTVALTVTLNDDGEIVAIDIIQQNETQGIGSIAIEQLPDAIIAAQSVDIDGVTGASMTSRAIFDAVRQALEEAGVQ